eukprot:COSAG06_NODE_6133_length_3092_cov_1.235884_1_plen_193_part_00
MGNAENKGAFCVFCRANVHDCSGRSSHAKHNHELSTVSGVYYTRTPGGSAPLRFFDPRGAHALVEALGAPLGVDTSTPPFVDGLSVDAVQGRLVTFPGCTQLIPSHQTPAPLPPPRRPKATAARARAIVMLALAAMVAPMMVVMVRVMVSRVVKGSGGSASRSICMVSGATLPPLCCSSSKERRQPSDRILP